MRTETTITPFPSGSGRYMDWMYPTTELNRSTSASPLVITSRNSADTGTNGFGLGGSGTLTCVVQKGVPSVLFATTAVGGATLSTDGCVCMRAILQKGHAIPTGYNDWASYRHVITMAFDANFSATTVDYGYEMYFPANNTGPAGIIAGAVGGIGWVRRPSGSAALIIQGAGFHEFDIATPGFDPTAFHTYELRINSATQTSEASLKALVDNVLFQSFSWGAGSILPLYIPAYRQAAGGFFNRQGIIGSNLWVYDAQWSAGPTEQACL